MGILGKFISVLLHIILPPRIREAVLNRIERTKTVLTSNLELRIFWRILFFPIVLPLSLLMAAMKTLMIWVFPSKVYNDLRYICYQIYTDVSSRNTGIRLAWKRACLCYELFTKGAEKHMSYGEKNPEITFYVIRPYYFLEPNEFIYRNVANLLTQYYYCLQKLSYAVENGWVPVVDWQNYGMMPHSEEFPVNGTSNAWEYYWQQPSSYSLEEVYQSKNVILSTRNIGQFGYIPNCAMAPPFMQYATGLVQKCPQYASLFPFNQPTLQYIEDAHRRLFPEGKRVLGVVVRGASYGRSGTPYGSHPVQVGMKELIRTVKNYCGQWEMDYVFFVNEMQELVETMQDAFQDRLIVLPRMRDHIDRPADGITKNPMYYPGNRYQTNLDYITEIALLSKCTSLIGSMSSGMRSALIWNAGDYENVLIFEKGLW
ncbi:hypothetical protein NBH08_22965 [Faecalicatena sp. BF-R-105]|nr:hypothetical protein [Faecalicatena sp. BF-R-105]